MTRDAPPVDPNAASAASMEVMGALRPREGQAAVEPVQDPRLGAAAAGDRAAVESLLLELLPRVRNLVRYLVRGDDAVDDMAQEALIAVLRGLPTYRAEGTLTAWADRVTARAVFTELRRRRAVRGRLELLRDDAAEAEAAGGDPEEYLARRRAVERLDELPDEQRQALVLHHLVGLSVPELARELAVPAETVRSRLRLGKQRLREAGRSADETGEGA
jgi:RNA polymerase sigma-70 factor, ECF subfamily